jgi:membrane protease YdiL (CAAX protease family)
MILAGLLGERLPRSEGLPLLPAVVLQGLLLGVVFYPLLYRAAWSDVRTDLGLGSGGGGLKEAMLGPVGYVASLPLVAVGVMVTLLLVQWTGQDVSEGVHPIVPMIKGEQASAVNVAMALLVAVVMAPVLEEITFRGFFYGALRARFPAWVAILVSAGLFAGIHPQGLIGLPMLMAIGAMLAALREWRGSLIAPIVAHGCTNGVTLAIVLLGF